jgi:hypothetical protein
MKLVRNILTLSISIACLVGTSAESQAPASAPARQFTADELAARPTPRLPNGKPDLSGMWNGSLAGPRGDRGIANGDEVYSVLPARDGDLDNYEYDSRLMKRTTSDIPIYKPKYWEKVNELDLNSYKEDTGFHCMPLGVPRLGAPTKIVQKGDEAIFIHTATFQENRLRIVPTDGKPHNPEDLLEGTWMGVPAGHWEGDTLVVDNRGFNDQSWLSAGTPGLGFFHTADMRVIERLTRRGDTLRYEVRVEDPEVLAEPWTPQPKTLFLNTTPGATVQEAPYCSERDANSMTFNLR